MQKLVMEPLSDPINLGFAGIMLSVLLVSGLGVIARRGSLSSFDRYAPAALTTLGVLGTFTGVYVGLVDFDVKNIDGSIPSLLSGLKVAFFTSIIGMSGSVLLKLLQGLRAPKDSKDDVSAADIYQVMSEVRDESKIARERNENLLTQLRGAISGDGEASLVTQIQKLRTSVQDGNEELKKGIVSGFAGMTEEFRVFGEKVAENNSKALIEALNDVIRDFNLKISEQFGDNFKQLNEGIGALLVWQDKYKSQVETMVQQFELVKAGITDARDAVAAIGRDTAEIPKTMSAFKDAVVLVDSQIQELNAHLSAVADLKDRAVNAFPMIEENIVRLTTGFSSAVSASADVLQRLMDEQAAAVRQASDASVSMLERSAARHEEVVVKLEAGYEELPRQVEKVATQLNSSIADLLTKFSTGVEAELRSHSEVMEVSVRGLREGLEKGLTQTNDVIQQSFQIFDEQMQQEVQRVVELMGGHLASLSNKFVEDYGPLTDKLRRVVEISAAVGR